MQACALIGLCCSSGLVAKLCWVPESWCFWTVVLEKTLESPLDCKEIQPVHPKGDQSWIFIGRADAGAETPVLWPPDAKKWLIWKDPGAGNDWRWEVEGMTEDDMVGWHHQLNGHEVWVSSRSSWWTGKPGVLQSMGSQRATWLFGRTWLSEWTELETSWTAAHQAPLSMGFPRQKYWSELLFSSAGVPLDPGIKPWSLALQVDSLLTEQPGKPLICAAWWKFSVSLLHSRGFLKTPSVFAEIQPTGWKTLQFTAEPRESHGDTCQTQDECHQPSVEIFPESNSSQERPLY